MRFALWTFCLIITENFLHYNTYSLNDFPQVTGYDDRQKYSELENYRDEETKINKKLNEFTSQQGIPTNEYIENYSQKPLLRHLHKKNHHKGEKRPQSHNYHKNEVRPEKESKWAVMSSEYDAVSLSGSQPKPESLYVDGNGKKLSAKQGESYDRSDYEKKDCPLQQASHKKSKIFDEERKEETAGLIDMEQNDEAVSLSPASQSKMDLYGTEEKVREAFMKEYGTLPASIDAKKAAADKHYQEMKTRTLCRIPVPKIIKVDNVYPDVFKSYYPSCTILHQCSEESGCCSKKGTKCAPSSTQNVTLYFTVVTRTKSQTGQMPKKSIEGLSFINHTDCQCLVDNDRKARDIKLTSAEDTSKKDEIVDPKKCPCPSPFTSKVTADGTCICECYDQKECISYKKGLSFFSLKDQYCLFTNQCIHPNCTFGKYSKNLGRCPKQQERQLLH